MSETTFSSVRVLVWDIWLRNRTAMVWAAGLTLLGCVLTFTIRAVAPESIISEGAARTLFQQFAFISCGSAFLLVFAAFGYAEINSREDSSGFPKRLFT